MFFQNGDFDLWPWPLNSSKILSKAMSTPNFRSVAQTVQPWERWQTDTHTDTQTGPILYPRQLTQEGTRGKVGLLQLRPLIPWGHAHYILRMTNPDKGFLGSSEGKKHACKLMSQEKGMFDRFLGIFNIFSTWKYTVTGKIMACGGKNKKGRLASFFQAWL